MRAKKKKGIAIHCAHDSMVPLAELKPHPKNPNTHNERQIKLLAKIIEHQGWRAPIVVSNRSGYIVSGHARLKAGQLLKLNDAPVNHQNFRNEKDEMAHLVADNRIAELAEINPDVLKGLLKEMNGFDLDLLGFDQKGLEDLFAQYGQMPPTGEGTEADWSGMPEFNQQDKRSWRYLIVHFTDQKGLDKFTGLLGEDIGEITEKTRYIWFPKIENVTAADKRWKTKTNAKS